MFDNSIRLIYFVIIITKIILLILLSLKCDGHTNSIVNTLIPLHSHCETYITLKYTTHTHTETIIPIPTFPPTAMMFAIPMGAPSLKPIQSSNDLDQVINNTLVVPVKLIPSGIHDMFIRARNNIYNVKVFIYINFIKFLQRFF